MKVKGRSAPHNRNGFRFDWIGRDVDILKRAVDIVIFAAPGKFSHSIFEAGLRKHFGKRIADAGSWAISLEHNRLCRLCGISCKKGSGDKELISQIPIVEEYMQSKFLTATFEFKRSLLKKRGMLWP